MRSLLAFAAPAALVLPARASAATRTKDISPYMFRSAVPPTTCS